MAKAANVDRSIRSRFQALRRLSWEEQRDTIRALGEGRGTLDDTLLLLTLMDDRDAKIRETALEALGNLGGPFARLAVRAALNDPNEHVRRIAAEELVRVGNTQDISCLTGLLEDEDWYIRSEAATALGRIGGKRTLPLLVWALQNDEHPVVRRDAATALVDYGAEKAVVPLEAALQREEDELAQVGILLALIRLGQHEHFPAFLALLDSDDYLVQNNVINNPCPGDLAEEDLRRFLAAVEVVAQTAESPGTRGNAEETLRRLRPISPTEAIQVTT
jgi:HEAT repeat protein